MDKKKENSDKGFWGAIVIALLIGYAVGSSMETSSFNPRSLTKSDTIYTEDSIYKVNFKIESVTPNNKREQEPFE